MAKHTISFKHVGELSTSNLFKIKENEIPIGIKTPLSFGKRELFSMTTSLPVQIKDNFKNLCLTNHGERLGRYNYGANLRELTLELGRDGFEAEVAKRIKTATSLFMPFIELGTLTTSIDYTSSTTGTSVVNLLIVYNIPRLNLNNEKLEIRFVIGG